MIAFNAQSNIIDFKKCINDLRLLYTKSTKNVLLSTN